MVKTNLNHEARQEVALALLLWRDFKSEGKCDPKVFKSLLYLAEELGITEELNVLMSKLPAMHIAPIEHLPSLEGTDSVPLDCACVLIAHVRNRMEIVDLTIQVDELSISEDNAYFEPKPHEESIALVRKAILERKLPEVRLAN
jgi:hypothetical protein